MTLKEPLRLGSHGDDVRAGAQFGRLTLMAPAPRGRGGQARWFCKCVCGGSTTAQAWHLKTGHTTSCGCFNREVTGNTHRTHGLQSHPLYRIWSSMLTRCRNPRSSRFPDYGGRGIGVCDRWGAFESFYADMIDGYRPGLTLDREDNELGYSPENCRWASRKEQSRNQRTNRVIDTPQGAMLLCEAAEVSGIGTSTLSMRLQRGWPTSRLFEPLSWRGQAPR